jgi:hypothetical protein
MVLSRLAGASERLAFLDRLRSEVSGTLTTELLERYFEHSDATRRPKPHFSLPWSSTIGGPPPDSRALVPLLTRRALHLRMDPEHPSLQFTFNGTTWRFPSATKVIYDTLGDGRAVSVEQLVAALSDAIGEKMARSFIARLVKEGIVWIGAV